jgi:hypothetical protein
MVLLMLLIGLEDTVYGAKEKMKIRHYHLLRGTWCVDQSKRWFRYYQSQDTEQVLIVEASVQFLQ